MFVCFLIIIIFTFTRDADETKDWIDDKNKALNTDNLGHDLHSVQALQRKHQGLERDLNALGKQVGLLLDGLSLTCSCYSVIATLVGGGREQPPLGDKNHH